MIYFMQPTDGGPVKIGFSDDLPTRHKQLERYYGQPLAILATIAGDQEQEAAIHRRFAHLRIAGRGRRGVRPEQFRPAPDLMEFIGRPLLVGPNPGTIEAIEPTGLVAIIHLKGSAAYHAWLEALNRETHIPKATLVRLGLELVAKEYKLRSPPEI